MALQILKALPYGLWESVKKKNIGGPKKNKRVIAYILL